jgi:CubicO group peptidase (beta-lactamase class C family)
MPTAIYDHTSDPESVGLSAERLADIALWYQGQIDAGALSGAIVAIVRNGRIAFLKPLGTQDKDKKIPMKPDAIFWIASMTKPITSVAAMVLVDEGKLDLTAPVTQYLPELQRMQVAVLRPGTNELSFEPQKRPMQVLDLLRHTAGLVYGDDYGDTAVHRLYDSLYETDGVWSREKTLADFITALAKLPLAHQPGEVWEYSHAVDVLARVAEVASGQPFDQFLQRRLFEPLGMVDTGFYVPEAKLARLVDPPPSGRPPVWDVTKPTKLFSGGGGLVSTAADYLRFCQMLLNGGQLNGIRILAPETVQRMTTNSLPSNIRFVNHEIGPAAGSTWGLGFAIRSDRAYSQFPGSVGSYMWGGVWGTRFWIDPVEGLIVLQMIQVPPGTSYPYNRNLRFLTYAALLDSEHQAQLSRLASPRPTLEVLASYVGTYDFGPRAEIKFAGLGLVVDKHEEQIKIMQVYEDAPAAKAGVLTGDVITDVEGIAVKGLALNQVRAKLVGPAGSMVTLKIVHDGAEQPFDVSIVRALIQKPVAQLHVRLEAGMLLVESTGAYPVYEFEQGKPIALQPTSNTEFLVDGGYRTRMAFVRDAEGKVSAAILNPGRSEQRGTKIN